CVAMVMFGDSPRVATVCAVGSPSLVAIGRDGLLALMKRNAELANKLLWSFCGILTTRLRNTIDSLAASKSENDALRK
ncbi:MAG: hypothetical protein JST92_09675, partial [Deltaproteobacteria bacterium]|nr:hypothetical protein [Deltaproteobacteria bacterium]